MTEIAEQGALAQVVRQGRRGAGRRPGAGRAGAAANGPKAASPSHTGAVPGPPDPNQVDTWIAVHADNTASVYTGRVEMGQGSLNGLLMIAGEELDMELSQLKFVTADSSVTPDTGHTVGSSSITSAGPQVRAGAAAAKQALLEARLDEPRRPGREPDRQGRASSRAAARPSPTAQLLGDKVFNTPMTAPTLNPGQGIAKPVERSTSSSARARRGSTSRPR